MIEWLACWCSLAFGVAKSLALACRRHSVNVGSALDSRSVSAGVAGTASRSEKRLAGTGGKGIAFV